MVFATVNRGDILQHRFSGEEGDGDRKCDPSWSTSQHFKGEERSALAIIIAINVVIIINFLIKEEK